MMTASASDVRDYGGHSVTGLAPPLLPRRQRRNHSDGPPLSALPVLPVFVVW
jgi:hypothetical protein